MPVPAVEWEKGKIKIIDQTELPREVVYLHLKSIQEVREAICTMKIRGAPALGVIGALGVAMEIQKCKARDYLTFKEELEKLCRFLESSRPTAVNLSWAIDRIRRRVKESPHLSIFELKAAVEREALRILEEDVKCTRDLGEIGASLVEDGDVILTHCNAGALATAGYGTALSVIYRAKEQGKKIKVFVDETRPFLQGARLTAWELTREKIPVTLICDNMAGKVMQEGKINKVIVGADRVSSNGDVANKIGTYTLAVLAREHKIPFYVACPLSTIDFSIKSGDEIPIEIRDKREITHFCGNKIVPEGIDVYNPAFDVTPSTYISAIITEKGVIYPPYNQNLLKLKENHKEEVYGKEGH